MRAILAVFVLAMVPLSGCVGDDAPDDPTEPDGGDGPAAARWAELAVPFGDGHDHEDASQHQGLSTPNFEVLGWDPLVTDYHGATSGDYLCGDLATGGERDIAVVHSFNTDVAFVVVDVTDPAFPQKIGEMELPNTHTYDVAVTDDASYVVLATSPSDTGPDEPPAELSAGTPNEASAATYEMEVIWRDACGNERTQHELVPYASGVVLVDLSDPSAPEVVDYQAQPPLGAHSVFATTIDGTHYVLASTTNLVHQASFFVFYTIEELPAIGGQLQEYGTYSAQYPGVQGDQPPLSNGHVDGWVQTHPVTDELVAYLADWSGGLIIVRLDGPGQITTIGAWNDYDPNAGAAMTGQIHEALPMADTWDGVHYTFIGQEVGGRPANRPTGQVIMMDTTDPTRPTPVARWTLPVDVEFGGSLQFSTHYVEVVGRTLFVSLYHGGVWAVDATPGQGTELPATGVFIPDRVSPSPPPEHLQIFRWAPTVLDVLAKPNGDLVVFDSTSGLYTVRYDDANPMASPQPWTEDAWIGQ